MIMNLNYLVLFQRTDINIKKVMLQSLEPDEFVDEGINTITNITNLLPQIKLDFHITTDVELSVLFENSNKLQNWDKILDGINLKPKYIESMITNDFLRLKRVNILEAWDTYKLKVLFGEIEETVEDKTILIKWFNLVLDLNTNAIFNVPVEITVYM